MLFSKSLHGSSAGGKQGLQLRRARTAQLLTTHEWKITYRWDSLYVVGPTGVHQHLVVCRQLWHPGIQASRLLSPLTPLRLSSWPRSEVCDRRGQATVSSLVAGS